MMRDWLLELAFPVGCVLVVVIVYLVRALV